MLTIIVPAIEMWDESKEEFVSAKEQVLFLEHSLVSLSKWEKKWHKSFLFTKEKTNEEAIDYIRCMTLNSDVDQDVYSRLTRSNFDEINKYMENPMTATTFRNVNSGGRNSEIVTAELIYYWMISLGIPYECREWHLNQLITLIRVCSIKNSPNKKMSRRELMSQNAALNAARRQQFNSKG